MQMNRSQPDCTITIPSQTQFLKMVVGLSKHVSTLAGFPLAEANKISLAVDEAATNVIKHSFGHRGDRSLTIEYYLSDEGLRIRIIFAGLPPNISENEVNLQQMIKNKKKGGLGVEMIRRIMDRVEYGRLGRQNYCEMVKCRMKT